MPVEEKGENRKGMEGKRNSNAMMGRNETERKE